MTARASGSTMNHQRLLALAAICAVAAFLILVLRVAHPRHRQLALVIYGIGWVPFILSIRKLWMSFHGQTQRILRWKTHILVGIAFLIFGWAFKVLIPIEKSSLLEIEMEHLPAILEEDLQRLAFIDSKMQRALVELRESSLLERVSYRRTSHRN